MKDNKKKLSPIEQEAKMSVLKDIMGDMDQLMCNDLDTKKKMKVSVMSDSKEGLEKGLSKAEDIVGSEDSSGVYPELDDESEEEDESDISSMSSDEIDAKIKELLALKEQKSVKAPF